MLVVAPSGFDRVVVLAQGSRHIHLSWDPPANSNGILVNYTIIQDCVVVAATLPTSQSYNVTDLQPFTSYNFSVMVCTSAACATSQQLLTSTLEDGKGWHRMVKGGHRMIKGGQGIIHSTMDLRQCVT